MTLAQEKAKLDKILSKSKKILITSHKQPDPDAFGSVIGFKCYVDKYFPGAEASIHFSGPLGNIGSVYSFLRGHKFLNSSEDINEIKEEFDTFVFLDGSEVYRFTNFPDDVKTYIFNDANASTGEKTTLSKGTKRIATICIDHHLGDPDDYDFYYRDSTCSSCSEILCEMLFTNEDLKDYLLSEALFMGIHGDTGGFSFVDAQKARVFSSARRLVENAGLIVQNILLNLEYIDEESFKFMSTFVANTINYTTENTQLPSVTYSYLTKSEAAGIADGDIKSGRALYIAQYLRKVKGYPWGFVLTPDADSGNYRLSTRSIPGSVNVQEVCKLFGGGGHVCASGGDLTSENMGISKKEFDAMDSPEMALLFIKRVSDLFDNGKVHLNT